jgi:hypothetical protein
LLLAVRRLRAVFFRWDPLDVEPPREGVLEADPPRELLLVPLLLLLLLLPELLDERELRVFV